MGTSLPLKFDVLQTKSSHTPYYLQTVLQYFPKLFDLESASVSYEVKTGNLNATSKILDHENACRLITTKLAVLYKNRVLFTYLYNQIDIFFKRNELEKNEECIKFTNC